MLDESIIEQEGEGEKERENRRGQWTDRNEWRVRERLRWSGERDTSDDTSERGKSEIACDGVWLMWRDRYANHTAYTDERC